MASGEQSGKARQAPFHSLIPGDHESINADTLESIMTLRDTLVDLNRPSLLPLYASANESNPSEEESAINLWNCLLTYICDESGYECMPFRGASTVPLTAEDTHSKVNITIKVWAETQWISVVFVAVKSASAKQADIQIAQDQVGDACHQELNRQSQSMAEQEPVKTVLGIAAYGTKCSIGYYRHMQDTPFLLTSDVTGQRDWVDAEDSGSFSIAEEICAFFSGVPQISTATRVQAQVPSLQQLEDRRLQLMSRAEQHMKATELIAGATARKKELADAGLKPKAREIMLIRRLEAQLGER